MPPPSCHSHGQGHHIPQGRQTLTTGVINSSPSFHVCVLGLACFEVRGLFGTLWHPPETHTGDCCCCCCLVAKLCPTLLRLYGLQHARLLCSWNLTGDSNPLSFIRGPPNAGLLSMVLGLQPQSSVGLSVWRHILRPPPRPIETVGTQEG